ncbi:MAG: Tat pathway signal protein [Bacteroidetes bacterium]|nr:Tat pathway signal protein [Bacteroidota bacterium]
MTSIQCGSGKPVSKLTVILALALLAIALTPPTASRAVCQQDKTSHQEQLGLTAGDAAFLDSLEHRTFDYFWETTNPKNGLAPDRYPTRTFSSIAAVGFALTSYPIGVERGYITREQAIARVLTTLRFFRDARMGPDETGVTGYKGFYYHFLDLDTGTRFDRVELSTIDSAILMYGVLFCQTYFDRNTAEEEEIRSIADSLYLRMNWHFFERDKPLINMGWTPEKGYAPLSWKGLDEAMLLYVLALGSPTYAVPPTAWTVWTKTYIWATYYGMNFISFGPLFGHQYSQCWIDFRGIKDEYMRKKGIDYFENSRRATISQRDYAIQNPLHYKGYSDSIWGFTASDGPGDTTIVIDGVKRRFQGYTAHGVSFDWVNDDGTITPAAAGGSMPFAPKICIQALLAMKKKYGNLVWRKYGFVDAFNPTYPANDGKGWFDQDYLGIDQGPVLIMLENYRTGFVWKIMRENKYIVDGLRRAGFTGGWLGTK